jgi:hypothetical protein
VLVILLGLALVATARAVPAPGRRIG